MRETITAFANEFAMKADDSQNAVDERTSINNPIVFLFLGDGATEALAVVQQLNKNRWMNSAGVVYLHIHSGSTITGDNIYSWRMDPPKEDKRMFRPALYRKFLTDESKLFELNVQLRRMNSRIAEYGQMYPSLQRVHTAVITCLDDPFNVLVPELTVMLKSVFSRSFRSVQTDLYVMQQENGEEEGYGYASSLGVGFLLEIDIFQRNDFSLVADLEVTQEGVKLSCVHKASPLFELVYLMSNRDEQGIVNKEGISYNYELISNLNMLKNQDSQKEFNSGNNPYNNQQFIQSLVVKDDGNRNSYVSAGYAQVRRPNKAIALTSLNHLFGHLMQHLEATSLIPEQDIMEKLGIHQTEMERKIRGRLPDRQQMIEDMYGIMHKEISYRELRQLTMQQAERELYGETALEFFQMVFNEVLNMIEGEQFKNSIYAHIHDHILKNPSYGSYSAYIWTDPDRKGGVVQTVRDWMNEVGKEVERIKEELFHLGQERVDLQSSPKFSLFGRFSNKSVVRSVTHQILGKIYSLRYDLLIQQMLHRMLKLYGVVLNSIHEQTRVHMDLLIDTQEMLLEMSLADMDETADYLGRNLNAYYAKVVEGIVKEWEQRWGKQFFFEDHFFGTITVLLEQGREALVQRLLEVAEQDLFSHASFHEEFEIELLKRANVNARPNVATLTPQELFRDLHMTLERKAAIRLDVYRTANKYRHEEKYLIGDVKSEFLQYVFSMEQKQSSSKIGIIDEKKRSGVEKLKIMGGFRLQDTMFFRNSVRLYRNYVKQGYEFHPVTVYYPNGFNLVTEEGEEAV
ncbi:hypothetical protein [Paenibacillus thalictri]|uniref:Transcription initiation factor TFIID n=1 Tax=Paenibacillus thalictri TaxID=2527873 RepID=A0A4Q9DY18_9BACL|nr:hypothetical protein [Paenibacillus thalictri]TBL80980.1 hypothetical protein EYB31_02445 [Paenibacillus thalictri]